jgi:hypothetical protein
MSLPDNVNMSIRGSSQKVTARTSQLNAKLAFNLAENLRIGSCPTALNILKHGLLLVDLHRKVLLGHAESHTGGLHSLSNGGVYSWRGSDFVFPIEFRNSLVVGACKKSIRKNCQRLAYIHDELGERRETYLGELCCFHQRFSCRCRQWRLHGEPTNYT